MNTFELCKKLYELKPDWQTVDDDAEIIKAEDVL